MATHSSILAWRILWTEEPGGLQSMGLQRVLRHDLVTKQYTAQASYGSIDSSLFFFPISDPLFSNCPRLFIFNISNNFHILQTICGLIEFFN